LEIEDEDEDEEEDEDDEKDEDEEKDKLVDSWSLFIFVKIYNMKQSCKIYL
jgi:hypothetical protein